MLFGLHGATKTEGVWDYLTSSSLFFEFRSLKGRCSFNLPSAHVASFLSEVDQSAIENLEEQILREEKSRYLNGKVAVVLAEQVMCGCDVAD